jgi:hypothetical protein
MNLISTTFTRDYRLIIHPLSEISFSSLVIRYADNREILIYYFINLEVDVEGI